MDPDISSSTAECQIEKRLAGIESRLADIERRLDELDDAEQWATEVQEILRRGK